ncbi:embryogenesis-associated protein EMB8-like isoform X1 [Quercus robur]|uniref:embryogenesis-associated protein EMB8-like isoform X1 n=1 Tax=Quercus robur TaxID=38942 RepID=UPI0021626F98|nr:embryogenesis-associated protein EMB8-like isoform X1 [Quercus robur]
MAVGWEYGANMLTKYLAEAGENTPLTAATCIDNPLDLEEATRSSPYQMAIDQKLIGGLIDILRSNKLFSRNYFKTKQKGLTWRRLYWQSLFMILKKQYLWYLSTRDVVGNVSKQGRFIKLNVLC